MYEYDENNLSYEDDMDELDIDYADEQRENRNVYRSREQETPVREYRYEEYGGNDTEEEARPKKKKNGFKKVLLALLLILCTAGGGVLGSYYTVAYMTNHNNNVISTEDSTGKSNASKVILSEQTEIESTEAIADALIPTVVGISTKRVSYDYFYGQQMVQGVGSGVIANENGYIITNHHVVGDAEEINVYFSDGREAKGETLWSDESLDLAIVKVDLNNLPVATLGDSDEVKIGQKAIAIGNPLGLDFQRTLTQGVISGLDRTLTVQDSNSSVPTTMENLIQTDAAINNGNSGGPLINRSGEVIGINTLKASSAESMGFAIPINIIKPILANVIENGRFQTPYMGISVIDQELANYYGAKTDFDTGIYVADVEAGQPAAQAGLQVGDVITKVDGKTIDSRLGLKIELYKHNIGDVVTVEYVRNNKTYTTELTLKEYGMTTT